MAEQAPSGAAMLHTRQRHREILQVILDYDLHFHIYKYSFELIYLFRIINKSLGKPKGTGFPEENEKIYYEDQKETVLKI